MLRATAVGCAMIPQLSRIIDIFAIAPQQPCLVALKERY
jgi:hypothetical protein